MIGYDEATLALSFQFMCKVTALSPELKQRITEFEHLPSEVLTSTWFGKL